MMLFVRYECGHLLPSNKTAVYPTLAMDSLSVINDVPSEVPELEETSINLQEIHTRVCVYAYICAQRQDISYSSNQNAISICLASHQ